MVREGLVVKSESRPVLFMEASVCEELVKKAEEEDGKTAFSNLIGRNGSLKFSNRTGKISNFVSTKRLTYTFGWTDWDGKNNICRKDV